MELDIKPPIAVVAFRWAVNTLAFAGLVSLMGYIIPWVAFWSVKMLFGVEVTMTIEHIAALWVLNIVWGFMTGFIVLMVPKKK